MINQFLVPQFIDVEDKIIGPVTVRQFVLMLVATLLIFISYKLLRFWLFSVVGLLLFGIFGILAFLKINGQPFHYFLLNLFQTGKRAKIRVWNKKIKESELKKIIELEKKAPQEVEVLPSKKVSVARLSKLSLIVNTGGVYQGDQDLGLNISIPDTSTDQQNMPKGGRINAE